MAAVSINGLAAAAATCFWRAIAESGGRTDIEVFAIQQRTAGPGRTMRNLLPLDSVHGRFLPAASPATVTVEGDSISLGTARSSVGRRDPAKLPLKELGRRIALESTASSSPPNKASSHVTAGASACWSPRPRWLMPQSSRATTTPDQGSPGCLERLCNTNCPWRRSPRVERYRRHRDRLHDPLHRLTRRPSLTLDYAHKPASRPRRAMSMIPPLPLGESDRSCAAGTQG